MSADGFQEKDKGRNSTLSCLEKIAARARTLNDYTSSFFIKRDPQAPGVAVVGFVKLTFSEAARVQEIMCQPPASGIDPEDFDARHFSALKKIIGERPESQRPPAFL